MEDILEVRDFPETQTGKGLVAIKAIIAGTRILCEKPLLITPMEVTLTDEHESRLATRLKARPKYEQRQFLSLHNNYAGSRHPLSGVLKSNSLPCGAGQDFGTRAVYRLISLINHSCSPNACHNWNEDAGHMTVHTTKDIQAGEQIFISYGGKGPTASRQAFLKEHFGFDCACETCSRPIEHVSRWDSDERRQALVKLEQLALNESRVQTAPAACLQDCLDTLLVLHLEKLYGRQQAEVHERALSIAMSHGDVLRGGIFLKEAFHVRMTCEGADSPATRRLVSFLVGFTQHPDLRKYSRQWDPIPTDMTQGQYESWLYRTGEVRSGLDGQSAPKME
ncbi:hypothetical protein P8C59_004576 [Phyllachora maydis]|uniref:SET domain-containing protein n=1 Tax=Phyllachora maydis TaxID=1825666 RepID=A0AAD9I4D1_9PEZI|nr:hypothetical protein P8C59_004576 [Phyllachora maydis]